MIKKNPPYADSDHTFLLEDLLPVDTDIIKSGVNEHVENFVNKLSQTSLVEKILSGTIESPSDLKPEIVQKIAEKTGMPQQWKESEIQNENASTVCYSESSELREEFKTEILPQHFSVKDLVDYVFGAILEHAFYEKQGHGLKSFDLRIDYPKSQYNFWQRVRLGRTWRSENQQPDQD